MPQRQTQVYKNACVLISSRYILCFWRQVRAVSAVREALWKRKIPVQYLLTASGSRQAGHPQAVPQVGRLTVSISAVGCAGDELQPCYYRKLHHQTSLSFRRERVYDVKGGLFAESWSAQHWITVGGSRVRLLSMTASPAKLSARCQLNRLELG